MYRSICMLTLVLNVTLFAGFSDPDKQKKWDEMEMQINQTVDGLGKPIDPKIKRTVIILNILGFSTNASCEGHADRGVFPWVRFEATVDKSSQTKIEKYTKKSNKEQQKLTKKYHKKNIYNLGKKSKKLIKYNGILREEFDAITHESKKHLLPLHDLIAAFYETRQTVHERILYIHFFGGYQLNTLQSIGSEWEDCYSLEEKEEKLKEYQEEMDLFTEFLIDYYDKN